jgi:protein TonB
MTGAPWSKPAMTLRQRLEALYAADPWWGEALDEIGPPPPARKAVPPWHGALAAAVTLHLAVASLALLNQQGVSAPSPGTGAPTFDVTVLPAWPEPGHHTTQLGAIVKATQSKGSGLTSKPNPQKASIAVPTTAATNLPPISDPTISPAPVAAAVQTTEPARADAPPSTPSATETLWETDVLAKLASQKHYPARARRAGEQDTVMVRFVLDRAGQVLSADVIESKGLAALDAEALALIRRAAPLPPPPVEVPGDTIELIAPIQFILHGTS